MGKKRKKPETLAEALLQAFDTCGKTRYRISQESGIDEGTLSRFVNGVRPDIKLSTVDKLLPVVGLTWTAIEPN